LKAIVSAAIANMGNVKQKEMYDQVCVWAGTTIKTEEADVFVKHFKNNGWRVQFLETIITRPNTDAAGCDEADTGGRDDAFFAIHNDDLLKFSIPRLQMGIRWIEDVLDNESRMSDHSIYPERVKRYRCW